MSKIVLSPVKNLMGTDRAWIVYMDGEDSGLRVTNGTRNPKELIINREFTRKGKKQWLPLNKWPTTTLLREIRERLAEELASG